MKKNVLLTILFSVLLNGVLFSQLDIQNGSFEDPADDIKFRADGEAGAMVFNGNVPGWWADTSATDCGRQDSGKPAYDGTYVGFAFNNDGGSIWSVAGTVEDDIRELNVILYAWESFPAGQTGVSIALIFAVYEGTDTIGFTVLDTLTQPFDPGATDANGWGQFIFTEVLPESAEGKNLLIGFDIITESAENSWFSFDNFMMEASVTGIEDNIAGLENIKVFPNPVSDFLSVQIENNSFNRYALYNVAGQEVISGIVNENKTIDVRTLDKGIYFLKVENSLESKVVKIIIE